MGLFVRETAYIQEPDSETDGVGIGRGVTPNCSFWLCVFLFWALGPEFRDHCVVRKKQEVDRFCLFPLVVLLIRLAGSLALAASW